VGSKPPCEAPDLAWWQDPAHYTAPLPRPRAFYVETRAGVRLAVDLYLPTLVEGETVPALLIQTRYFRRSIYRPWAGTLGPMLGREGMVAPFVARGYAVVVVDTRGSGASFGYKPSEISAEEVADAADVCDWIVDQPWSSGVIGSIGSSAEGSTAEALLRTRHPAVKAAAPQRSVFDFFADLFAPGGVRSSWFIRDWAALVEAKDRNDQEEAFAGVFDGPIGMSLMLTAGVAPVDGDEDGSLLGEAIAEHRDNYDLVTALQAARFRDDVDPPLIAEGQPRSSVPVVSPVLFLDDIIASGAAIYSWCGWYDGAFVNSAVKRWVALRDHGCRLILGPWEHGNQLPDPTNRVPFAAFDHVGEALRFFDAHLKGERNAIVDEPPVHYYTVGEGRWKESATWPPPGFAPTPLYLSEHRALTRGAPPGEWAADTYRVDFGASSGLGSRWRGQANLQGAVIGWPDRAEQDALLLVYDSEPLERDLEVTGHPVLTLHLTVEGADTAVHAYLEDVTEEGEIRYVTEGILRAVHRAEQESPRPWDRLEPYHTFLRSDAQPLVPGETAVLRFGLLPCSYLFRAGSRIRLALAGADADNFERVPAIGPAPVWHVQRTAAHPSHIALPALER
jgi:putative CocE/NonD family hydrolase